MTKKCEECGKELLPEWKYCPECGRDIQENKKTNLSRAEEIFLVGKALSVGSKFLSAEFDFVQEVLSDSKLYSENKTAAFKYYKRAAELGIIEARIILGRCYQIGIGTEKNYNEAVKCLKDIAEQGTPAAQAMIGSMYLQGGAGLERDIIEAVRWLKSAAENGNDVAQYLLGKCYYYGSGLEKNLNESKRLLQLSAKQKNQFAKMLLLELFGEES